jgi:ATP-dependent Clp protease ATP-binding subunit ClpA
VTSNIGSLHLLDGIDAHGEIRDDARGQLLGELRALRARAGSDPVYGARPLRRYIQRVVETQIAAPCSPATSSKARQSRSTPTATSSS